MIPLTGSEGLFTRIGKLLLLKDSINLFRGVTITGWISEINQQYISTDQNIIESLYTNQSSYQVSCGSIMNYVKSVASGTVTQMANDDGFNPSGNGLPSCMQYLIDQMLSSSDTVRANTVSISLSSSISNIGNLIIVSSVRNRAGRFLEDVFSEQIVGTVVTDAQSNSARGGSETVAFVGETASTNPLNWDYPFGSGVSKSYQAIDAAIQSGGVNSNWLLNGNFESWTVANDPDHWNIVVGIPGTTIKKSTSQFYDGLASLQIVGNSSELTSLNTQFSTYQFTGNVRILILPSSQFAFSLFYLADVIPAAGVFRICLVDASGNVILDDYSNPNIVSVNLATASAVWTNLSGVFRTPSVMPSKVYLKIQVTTAISTGTNLYIDHFAFTSMNNFYSGGPYISVFSANKNSIIGDSYGLTVDNNYFGGFQYGFDELFGMKQLGLLLPSATGSLVPTIPDP